MHSAQGELARRQVVRVNRCPPIRAIPHISANSCGIARVIPRFSAKACAKATIVGVGDENRAIDNPTPQDCERGLAEARDVAEKIIRGEGEPLRLADGIYWAGYLNGGFAEPVSDPVCPELNDIAGEMVQLTASIHIAQDKVAATQEAVASIREVAKAFLEGRPLRPDNT